MKVLHIAFLWHQHQPYYKDLVTGRYALPWVRLHATKDYYDMAAILDQFPDIRATFNLVPSLMAQLEDYAQDAQDEHLALTLAPAADLTVAQRIWILENFFMAHWDTMVAPHPRYAELLAKRGKTALTSKDLERLQSYFTKQDILDLQVWFNLAWMDPYWKEHDSLVKELVNKGSHYTEEDKRLLVAKQREICGKVIAKHKELQDRGQIEVSTTPYYHPIMPLLADNTVAKTSLPDIALPRIAFQHPEDLQKHLQKAVAFYESRFGRKPRGLWPSEGSVSEAILPYLAQEGIQWIATDEEVLHRSLETPWKPHHLLKPYQLSTSQGSLSIFFRHHVLSDAIGFVYNHWPDHKSAVKDFVKRLAELRDHIPADHGEAIVPIILDGENCWETYKNDGWDFLHELYQTLSHDHRFRTVCFSDYLQQHPATTPLSRLWPGSWINANFRIWIGHAEDNAAWEALKKTRDFLTEHLKNHPEKSQTPQAEQAWEEIFIAEGSDWCWWYGDDHSSLNDAVFDQLFRKHLANVYTLMGEKAPEYSHIAIKKQTYPEDQLIYPQYLIKPKIDGLVSSYFEWRQAGYYKTKLVSSAMHKTQNLIEAVFWGFDQQKLYLRLDFNKEALNSWEDDGVKQLQLQLLPPLKQNIGLEIRKKSDHFELKPSEAVDAAMVKTLEFAIPFQALGLQAAQQAEFVISLSQNNQEIERWPYQKAFSLEVPTADFRSDDWVV